MHSTENCFAIFAVEQKRGIQIIQKL